MNKSNETHIKPEGPWSKNPSPADLEIINQQLGRAPEGIYEIPVREISNGRPAVLKVWPIVRKNPFPNLYWLSHPELVRAISHLESTGLIKELEDEILPANNSMHEKLKLAHSSYRDLRQQELQRYLKEVSPDSTLELNSSQLESLANRGIGGVQDFSRVRCLHMHYAHHLAHPGVNPIGEYLDKHFELMPQKYVKL